MHPIQARWHTDNMIVLPPNLSLLRNPFDSPISSVSTAPTPNYDILCTSASPQPKWANSWLYLIYFPYLWSHSLSLLGPSENRVLSVLTFSLNRLHIQVYALQLPPKLQEDCTTGHTSHSFHFAEIAPFITPLSSSNPTQLSPSYGTFPCNPRKCNNGPFTLSQYLAIKNVFPSEAVIQQQNF